MAVHPVRVCKNDSSTMFTESYFTSFFCGNILGIVFPIRDTIVPDTENFFYISTTEFRYLTLSIILLISQNSTINPSSADALRKWKLWTTSAFCIIYTIRSFIMESCSTIKRTTSSICSRSVCTRCSRNKFRGKYTICSNSNRSCPFRYSTSRYK